MSAYIPEIQYGFTGRDERGRPTHGLLPWPEHLRPRAEAPSQTSCRHEKFAATRSSSDRSEKLSPEMPVDIVLTDPAGVVFLTLDSSDRLSIATTIERLINMLDDADGDPDFEGDEREPEETDQNGDEGDYGRCEDDALAGELYNVPFGPLVGGQGL